MLDYFNTLFCGQRVNVVGVVNCLSNRVTADHNSRLIGQFHADEVKASIFSMHSDKSPAPDGLNPSFFQHFWDIIGQYFTDTCLSILTTGQFPRGLNDTQIVLITTMINFRPISLCNVLYKIVAKI